MYKAKKNWWTYTVDEVVREFQTMLDRGLSQEEARRRLNEFGFNQLPEQKKVSVIQLFINQFINTIVLVLIGASFIAIFLGELADALAIGVIVIINAIIGFVQEYSAERSLEALRNLTHPMSRVIRDGIVYTVFSRDLVPGDIVVVEAGDRIPADGRIFYAAGLATQEAALTGESVPVEKSTELLREEKLMVADIKNMAFMGTIVVAGKGKMLVTATGLATELGSISSMLHAETEQKTPLQVKLDTLGRNLLIICFGIIFIILVMGLVRGGSLIEVVLTALSLAVAAIPEGLPAVTTIALALGVRRMAKRNALIRRLTSVETLGCTTVICTDKTGTLTKNEMEVKSIWVNDAYIGVSGSGYIPTGEFKKDGKVINVHDHAELALALKIGAYCNSAELLQTNDEWNIVGDPTEGALLVVAHKAGFTKQKLDQESILVQEFPFDSDRKRMSMIREIKGKKMLFVKGASDVIINHSDKILINGQELALTEEYKRKILQAIHFLSQQALRVLAVAYRSIDSSDSLNIKLENNLVFVGLVGMMDLPRPEAKRSLELCKKAGIHVVMITGDHKETAVAVAKALGLIHEGLCAVSGAELDHLSDDELIQNIRKIIVYARVSVEQKVRIVKAWKFHGEIVAMTGDGVNDAPAIKAADIGIAMGLRGTEVAKEASDMVITDDNFASIVNAVEEGRGIYDNIIKFVQYLFSANIAEILIIFVAYMLGFRDATGAPFVCLMPIQLLWLNLITDGLPALALSIDPLDPQAMNRPPRSPSEAILSVYTVFQLIIFAFIITVAGIVVCHMGLKESAHTAHTMVLTLFIFLEFVRLMLVRARYHVGLFSNKWLIASVLVSLILHIFILYVPLLQKLFGTIPLTMYHWEIILIAAGVVLLLSIIIQSLFIKFYKSRS